MDGDALLQHDQTVAGNWPFQCFLDEDLQKHVQGLYQEMTVSH
jgi:hypothetical protein